MKTIIRPLNEIRTEIKENVDDICEDRQPHESDAAYNVRRGITGVVVTSYVVGVYPIKKFAQFKSRKKN